MTASSRVRGAGASCPRPAWTATLELQLDVMEGGASELQTREDRACARSPWTAAAVAAPRANARARSWRHRFLVTKHSPPRGERSLTRLSEPLPHDGELPSRSARAKSTRRRPRRALHVLFPLVQAPPLLNHAETTLKSFVPRSLSVQTAR